jgi:hypothetical protein
LEHTSNTAYGAQGGSCPLRAVHQPRQEGLGGQAACSCGSACRILGPCQALSRAAGAPAAGGDDYNAEHSHPKLMPEGWRHHIVVRSVGAARPPLVNPASAAESLRVEHGSARPALNLHTSTSPPAGPPLLRPLQGPGHTGVQAAEQLWRRGRALALGDGHGRRHKVRRGCRGAAAADGAERAQLAAAARGRAPRYSLLLQGWGARPLAGALAAFCRCGISDQQQAGALCQAWLGEQAGGLLAQATWGGTGCPTTREAYDRSSQRWAARGN